MTTGVLSRRATGLHLHLRSSVALGAVTLLGFAAFFWPLLDPSLLATHSGDAPWLFVSLLPLALAVLYAELSDGVLDAKAVAVLGILAGVDAALRPLSGGGSGFTLVYLLIICGGRVFGRGFGFCLGSLALFASALLTAGGGAGVAVPGVSPGGGGG